eukprot:1144700-Pelagomonas_calceolata.AAC.1
MWENSTQAEGDFMTREKKKDLTQTNQAAPMSSFPPVAFQRWMRAASAVFGTTIAMVNGLRLKGSVACIQNMQQTNHEHGCSQVHATLDVSCKCCVWRHD